MGLLFVPGGTPRAPTTGPTRGSRTSPSGRCSPGSPRRRPETPATIARWLRLCAPARARRPARAHGDRGHRRRDPRPLHVRRRVPRSPRCSARSSSPTCDGRARCSRSGSRWRPVVAIGLVSYGIYLWHWPVIVFLTGESTGLSRCGRCSLARLGVIAALTVASYYLVELPVRRGWIPVRVRWVLYPLVAAVTVVAVFVGTTPSLVIKSYVRATLLRYAPAEPVRGAGGVVGERRSRSATPITGADPLRIVLLGDSMIDVAGPGVVAALDATGRVVAVNKGYPGFGISNDPTWRGYVRHSVTATHADVVLFTDAAGTAPRRWTWRPTTARCSSSSRSPARRARRASCSCSTRRPDRSSTSPPGRSPATSPRRSPRGTPRSPPCRALAPGRALYFPIAPSVELDGQLLAVGLPAARPHGPAGPPGTGSAGSTACTCARRASRCTPRRSRRTPRRASGCPSRMGRWWVNGWQRAPIVQSGDQFCPADHPAP